MSEECLKVLCAFWWWKICLLRTLGYMLTSTCMQFFCDVPAMSVFSGTCKVKLLTACVWAGCSESFSRGIKGLHRFSRRLDLNIIFFRSSICKNFGSSEMRTFLCPTVMLFDVSCMEVYLSYGRWSSSSSQNCLFKRATKLKLMLLYDLSLYKEEMTTAPSSSWECESWGTQSFQTSEVQI